MNVRRNLPLAFGLAGLGLVLVLAVLGPVIWGADADRLSGTAREGASAAHWLGTDALGRDVFARTMAATRLTLIMTLLATALAVVVGVLLGSAVWLAGRRIRELGLRLIDIMVSYPPVILALVVTAVLGAGPKATVIGIGVAGSPSFARLTANLAASVAGRDFVAMARLLGVPQRRLLARHLMPNMAEPLLVLVSVAFATVLVALSGLSFLGLGVQEPSYDWGSLLNAGLAGLYTNSAEAIGPAIAIVFTGLCAGFVGDGLAASFNPQERSAGGRRGGRTAKVLAATAPRTAPAETVAGVEGADAVLVAEDLSVVLPDGTRLVDGLRLRIGPGEIVGVVGESGSGKSVTAMSVARLLPDGLRTEAGALRLNDLDLLGDTDGKRLATEIGVVYQDPTASFNPALKLGGQLTETVRTHAGTGRDDAREQAVEQLRSVRVTSPRARLKQYPHELSGGMRQRAMIASALLTRPRLLIADEPTTALDVTVQADVLALLREINERDGTAVLFISHDIGVVTSICHRVLVMYAGRIVEELTAGELRAGHARHPYTQALLAATPRVSDGGERLAAIPGRPPQPSERPAGCAYAPRCPLVRDVCREERPEAVPYGQDGGAAACHALEWIDEPVGGDR
ncbi:dipeptide/oligopeptide/nickel ABC transporter permease/ATP-binding protein [Actinomadura sp. 9N407]|uniref:dipeptide/oligopeptide/nickel ABC transporter permease/ATP-binding protein n=1 Tax=Actinomadura sp. 9N407 TaxID=3375154 RepID=UPI003794985B